MWLSYNLLRAGTICILVTMTHKTGDAVATVRANMLGLFLIAMSFISSVDVMVNASKERI